MAKGRDYFIFNSEIDVLSAAEYFAKPVIRDTGRKRKQLEGSEQDGKQLDDTQTISIYQYNAITCSLLYCTEPLKKRLLSDGRLH